MWNQHVNHTSPLDSIWEKLVISSRNTKFFTTATAAQMRNNHQQEGGNVTCVASSVVGDCEQCADVSSDSITVWAPACWTRLLGPRKSKWKRNTQGSFCLPDWIFPGANNVAPRHQRSLIKFWCDPLISIFAQWLLLLRLLPERCYAKLVLVSI